MSKVDVCRRRLFFSSMLVTGSATFHHRALSASPANQAAQSSTDALKIFERRSFKEIDAGPKPYVLTAWGLHCAPCVLLLKELAQWQTQVRIVTLAVDSIDDEAALQTELAKVGLTAPNADAWVFGASPENALRYAVDPQWSGEKPRSWFVSNNGQRKVISGVPPQGFIKNWLSNS